MKSENSRKEMMNNRHKKIVRDKWLTVRLSPEEEELLKEFSTKTSCDNLSIYARNILLHKPVTLLYRNRSEDLLIDEIIQLKRELNAIGNNFNQLVHRLHTIDHTSELKHWVNQFEIHQKSIQSKTEEIKRWLLKIYEIWSQK